MEMKKQIKRTKPIADSRLEKFTGKMLTRGAIVEKAIDLVKQDEPKLVKAAADAVKKFGLNQIDRRILDRHIQQFGVELMLYKEGRINNKSEGFGFWLHRKYRKKIIFKKLPKGWNVELLER